MLSLPYSRSVFPIFSTMKKFSLLSLASLTLCVAAGATMATVHADDTADICQQIQDAMKNSRPGTLSYIRMQDQYNRNCLEIKSGCPSAAALDVQARGCVTSGMYSHFYIDASRCKQVRCSETAPTSSSSSSARSASSAAQTTGPCPNGDMLSEIAVGCRKKHLKFEYYTANGCRQVRCIQKVSSQASCPSPTELTKKVRYCKGLGRNYENYSEGVCKMIRCIGEQDSAGSIASASSLSSRSGVKPPSRRSNPEY